MARGLTECVVEAVKRGVDENVILELGGLYEDLLVANIDNGYYDDETVKDVGKALGLVHSAERATYDYAYINACFSEIRFRLTGIHDKEIED